MDKCKLRVVVCLMMVPKFLDLLAYQGEELDLLAKVRFRRELEGDHLQCFQVLSGELSLEKLSYTMVMLNKPKILHQDCGLALMQQMLKGSQVQKQEVA